MPAAAIWASQRRRPASGGGVDFAREGNESPMPVVGFELELTGDVPVAAFEVAHDDPEIPKPSISGASAYQIRFVTRTLLRAGLVFNPLECERAQRWDGTTDFKGEPGDLRDRFLGHGVRVEGAVGYTAVRPGIVRLQRNDQMFDPLPVRAQIQIAHADKPIRTGRNH